MEYKCSNCQNTEYETVENQHGIFLVCKKCGYVDEILAHKIQNNFQQETRNTPKCPTCQSTNIKKISTTSKVANTALFGLLGTKRHKTFHCNNCGYEW